MVRYIFIVVLIIGPTYMHGIAQAQSVANSSADGDLPGFIVPDAESAAIVFSNPDQLLTVRDTNTDSIRAEIEQLRNRLRELSKKLDDIADQEGQTRVFDHLLDSLKSLPPLPRIELYPKPFDTFILPEPRLIPQDRMPMPMLPEPPAEPKRSVPNPRFPGWRIELLRDMALNADSDGFISTPQPIVTNRLELPDDLARFLRPSASGVIVGQTK